MAEVETTQEVQEQAQEAVEQPKARTYTDEDVDAIVSKKLAKWREQQAKEVEEAKRMAQMDAAQKAEYERDKLQKELEGLRREKQVREMTAEGRKQLREKGVDVPDEVVSALVREDAETTKEALDAFADAFTASVEAEVKRRLAGEPPKSGTASKMTREDILRIPDQLERQKAIREHRDLFK